MVDRSVEEYYKQALRKIKPLSVEEEHLLCERIRRGDKLAQSKLIESSLKTVWQIAKKYVTDDVDLFDLIQEGNVGLINAAEKFSDAEDVRFNTYAIFWVKMRIQRYFHNNVRPVRIPVYREAEAHKVKVFRERYMEEHGYEPKINEIAESINRSESFVTELILDTGPCDSLDFTDRDGNSPYQSHFGDMRHNPEQSCCDESTKALVHQALKILDARDQEIIKLRYGFYDKTYTLKEVADKVGLSYERCRQLQKIATDKMAAFFSKPTKKI